MILGVSATNIIRDNTISKSITERIKNRIKGMLTKIGIIIAITQAHFRFLNKPMLVIIL